MFQQQLARFKPDEVFAQLDSALDETDRLQKRLDAAEARSDALRRDVDDANRENQRLKAQNDALTLEAQNNRQARPLNPAIQQQLENDKNRLARESQALQVQIQQLNASLRGAQQESRDLAASKQTLSDQLRRAQDANAAQPRLEQEVLRLKRDLQAAQCAIVEVHSAELQARLDRELQEVKVEAEQLKKQARQAATGEQRLELENRRLRDDLRRRGDDSPNDAAKKFLEKENTRLKEDAANRAIELEDLQRNCSDLEAQLRALPNAKLKTAANAATNDPKNFRDIAIFPVPVEVDPAFKARSLPSEESTTTSGTLDSCVERHFRLIREDFLIPIREVVDAYTKATPAAKIKSNRFYTLLDEVSVGGVILGDGRREHFSHGVKLLFKFPEGHRAATADAKYFEEHSKLVAEGSVVVLINKDDKVASVGHILQHNAKQDLRTQKGRRMVIVQFDWQGYATLEPRRDYRLLVIKSLQTFSFLPVLMTLKHLRTVPLEAELIRGEPHGNRIVNRLGDYRHMMPAGHIQLNDSQRMALHEAATRKVTLIQGPPGTGKTTVGVRVAEMLRQAGGPVLIVCYTNHALDQLLLRILDEFPHSRGKIKRFGSGGSDELQECVVKLSKNNLEHKDHKRRMRYRDEMEEGLEQLHFGMMLSSGQLREDAIPDGAWGFFDEDDFAELMCLQVSQRTIESFAKPKEGKRPVQLTQNYLLCQWANNKKDGMGFLKNHTDHRDSCQPLFAMSPKARTQQLRSIGERMVQSSIKHLDSRYTTIQSLEDTSCADELLDNGGHSCIFACTTSFAAKASSLLRALKPRSILVEEAGEILEGQVLATLPASCERIVMIGDHKQLRPKVQHRLKVASGSGLNLDRSLFERLALKPDFPLTMLNIQHRMFTQVSAIVRGLSYNDPPLQDAPHLIGAPPKKLKGLKQGQLTFIDTQFPEDNGDGQDSSKRNTKEAQFVAAVVRYLVQSGEDPKSITVLSPYLGQVKLLKSELAKMNLGALVGGRDADDLAAIESDDDSVGDDTIAKQIRVASVDNFQGEENDIILVSLVRNNKQKNPVGWLREAERVNVLLSRVKKALLVFGNKQTFMKSAVWEGKVFQALEGTGAIRRSLELQCRQPHHQEGPPVRVSCAEDFDKAPHGCSLPCNRKLLCGHTCTRRCHQDDTNHAAETKKCVVPVEFRCQHGHMAMVLCNKKATHQCTHCADLLRIRQRAERDEQKAREKFEKKRQKIELEEEKITAEEKLKAKAELDEKELELQKAQQEAAREERALALARNKDDLEKFTVEVHAKRDEALKLKQEAYEVKKQQLDDALQKAQEATAAREKELEAEIHKQAEALRHQKIREQELLESIRQTEEDPGVFLKELFECCICGDPFERRHLSVCEGEGAKRHFHCPECFEDAVTAYCGFDNFKKQELHAIRNVMPCEYGQGCGQECYFRNAFIHANVSRELSAQLERVTSAVNQKQGREEGAKEEQERQKRQADDTNKVGKHTHYIVENILTLKCPVEKCRKAYLDFKFCCALNCKLCGAAFCAWCQEDCRHPANDAHSHVAHCPVNPYPDRGGKVVDDIHHRMGEVQKERKGRLTEEYIVAKVEEELRDEVRKMVRPLL